MPPGALDCWVFLSCLEVLQRIEGCCDRAQIDSNIAHTVGLWSYATEKVAAECRGSLSVPLGWGWSGSHGPTVSGAASGDIVQVCGLEFQAHGGLLWVECAALGVERGCGGQHGP